VKRVDLVVFLGPSLPAREARALAARPLRCTILPPAAQGDVWRALALRPRAIALVDGVFESVRSVWHHEILDALDGGVAVFGGASMGALRAVELAGHGMVGVGRIHRWYVEGRIDDDAEVALLHAGPELGFRPLTLPLVAVRRAAEILADEGALDAREVRALVRAASEIHYARRTWRSVLAAVSPRLAPGARARLDALVRGGPPDPKAEDARATIAAAAAFAVARVATPSSPRPVRRPSSLVRREKLAAALSLVDGATVPGVRVVDALARRPAAARLADDGLRRALLSALARSLGVEVDASDLRAAREAWRRDLGLAPAAFERHLAACGLDAADAARLVEDLAVERRLLDDAARAVPDGPSAEEGLALAARLSGAWVAAARALTGGGAPAKDAAWPSATAHRATSRRPRRSTTRSAVSPSGSASSPPRRRRRRRRRPAARGRRPRARWCASSGRAAAARRPRSSRSWSFPPPRRRPGSRR
jgi:hypothetical protein